MSNIFSQDPLILDTAFSGTANLTSPVGSRPILAKRIEWLSPATIGNNVIITDINNNTILQGTCEVALQSQVLWAGPQKLTLPKLGWFLTTINSGKLLIWY